MVRGPVFGSKLLGLVLWSKGGSGVYGRLLGFEVANAQ